MNELYELPEGWEWKTLNDVFIIERGGSPRPIKEFITEDEDGINWIKIGDATKGDGKYITETEQKIKPSGLKSTRVVLEGDFIMSNSMSFGKPYIVKTKGAIHDGWLLMREKIEKTNKDFFYYLLSSNYMYEQFSNKASGTTVKNLNIDLVKTTNIPLPPLEEQKKIVGKLDLLFSKIDKAIELHQKNIDEADIFMASVLNDIFEELEEKHNLIKISDIAYIKGGKRLPKGEELQENKTDYPYIRVADFLDTGIINLKTIQYITKEIQEQIKNYTINSKNLYISIAGTIGKTGIIQQELDGANLTENAVKLVYKIEDISNKFVYYLTNSSSFKERIGIATKTVAQPKLAITRLAEVEIPIPPLETQKKVVSYLDEISSKIERIKELQKSKMQSLKELKASILDKAFKGEL